MATLKTAKEMDVIRKAQSILNEKAAKEFVPEKVEYRDVLVTITSRCDKGPLGWKGLFKISEVPIDDKSRMAIFKLTRKLLKEGISSEFLEGEMARALSRRCFR